MFGIRQVSNRPAKPLPRFLTPCAQSVAVSSPSPLPDELLPKPKA